MKAKSAYSLCPDSYRAGVELGERLQPVSPEAVFLFSSIQYAATDELQGGLCDALGGPVPIIAGATGDGFFERERDSLIGASALGLHTEGKGACVWARADGVARDVSGAVTRGLAELRGKARPRELQLVLAFSDFRTDASLLEQALQRESSCPVVGGLAGDDYEVKRCGVYCNGETVEDAVVFVGLAGPIPFDIRVARELRAYGEIGEVTRSEGRSILEIDGMPAMAFVEKAVGKPVLRSEKGIVAFRVYRGSSRTTYCMRSIIGEFGIGDGTVALLGKIPAGTRVQVCLADQEDMLADTRRIGAPGKSDIAAALLVNCAGRAACLRGTERREVDEFFAASGQRVPLAGFASFGEISSLKAGKGYGQPLFHNMTAAWLLLGT